MQNNLRRQVYMYIAKAGIWERQQGRRVPACCHQESTFQPPALLSPPGRLDSSIPNTHTRAASEKWWRDLSDSTLFPRMSLFKVCHHDQNKIMVNVPKSLSKSIMINIDRGIVNIESRSISSDDEYRIIVSIKILIWPCFASQARDWWRVDTGPGQLYDKVGFYRCQDLPFFLIFVGKDLAL